MSSPLQPTPGDVRQALEKIASSAGFQNSDRMVRFLRFVCEKALAGAAGEIKEYTLGVEVFDRAADFDPKTDTIVRVEARRLRRKLQEYYEGPGAGDAVRIDVPSPGYAPVFALASVAVEPLALPVEKRKSRKVWIVAAALAAVVLGAVGWWFARENEPRLASVAVLPFANMSGDAGQEYFSDGFTEELIDRLTAIDGLRVAARTSAFEFKNKAQDIRQIARRLNVDAIVEGSVRRSGDTVRITAQLIRTSDGYHIWSKSWDRRGSDVLAIETDVATAVADTFRQTLAPTHGAAPSLEAHDLYLLGRHHWNTLDPAELFKAVDYFQRAIAADPNYALAYSGLSEAYSYLIDVDAAPTREMGPKAKAAALKAIALDETLAEAHTSLGLVLMDVEWDLPGAGRELARALKLKPSFAYGIHWQAHYWETLGRVDEACAEMKRAIAIDPLSRMFNVDLAMCFFKARHYDEAMRQLEVARQLEPDWPIFAIIESVFHVARKEPGPALEAARRAEKLMGADPMALVTLAQAEALAGDTATARKQLAKMKVAASEGYVPAYALALASYAAGERDEGFNWMRRAVDERNGTLVWLGNSPMFDEARRDPRSAALLSHVAGR